MKFGFLLYAGIEPMDLASIGVVSMGKRVIPELSYLTIAENLLPCEFSNGLKVMPDFTYETCPPIDILLIPGGPGWVNASKDDRLLSFIGKFQGQTLVASLCTGAMILAATGLLDRLTITTKNEIIPPDKSPLEIIQEDFPAINAVSALIVDSGSIITGGGVSLCIDTVLYIISKYFGEEKTLEIARILEYSAAMDANKARMPILTPKY